MIHWTRECSPEHGEILGLQPAFAYQSYRFVLLRELLGQANQVNCVPTTEVECSRVSEPDELVLATEEVTGCWIAQSADEHLQRSRWQLDEARKACPAMDKKVFRYRVMLMVSHSQRVL